MNNLEKIRVDIAALKTRIATAESAGAPLEVASRLLQEQFDDLAGKYRHEVTRLAEAVMAARTGADIQCRHAFGMLYGKSDEFIIGALVHHLGDAISADIQREITNRADSFPPPLADAERATQLADLRRELRALERNEERMIATEEQEGKVIDRRPDADPVAVLGIPDGFCEEFQL